MLIPVINVTGRKTMGDYPVVYTMFVNNDELTTDLLFTFVRVTRYVAYFANRPSASYYTHSIDVHVQTKLTRMHLINLLSGVCSYT